MPEGFGYLPKDWSADQMAQFDRWFQSSINGDLAERRRIQWIPETGRPIQFSKTAELFDKGEEWLARVIAFAFSLSPAAFVQQMNRATAEQSQDTAEEEGEVPIMNWVKDEINAIIQSPVLFNEPDIEFVWSDQPDVDALKQAQIDEIYLRNGVRTVEEIRERDGLPPQQSKSGIVGDPGLGHCSFLLQSSKCRSELPRNSSGADSSSLLVP